MPLTPRPDQEKSIEHLLGVLKSNGAAVDASDTGVGKTLTAVEVIKRFDAPTVVVCPKIVIPAWNKTVAGQGLELDCINHEMVRTGRTQFGQWAPSGEFRWHKNIRRLVFDEVHRCQGRDSKNAAMLRAARKQGIYCLALSATIAEDPLDMNALGYTLRLHDGDNQPTLRVPEPLRFSQWAIRHGCRHIPGVGLEFTGPSPELRAFMAGMNRELFPAKGVRVRREDIPGFPETQILAELYDLGPDSERYAFLQSEMAEALAELHSKMRGFVTHPMERLLRARQEAELLKVPIMEQLAKDLISSGMSVLLFVCFTKSLQELCRRLNTDCFIDGSQIGPAGAERREANRLRFERNESRILIANEQAGGVGWNGDDIYGGHPRASLISPGYNAKNLRQVFGRPHRASSKSKSIQRVILAAGTKDENVHRALTRKLDCMDALNDGDLDPNNLEITGRF